MYRSFARIAIAVLASTTSTFAAKYYFVPQSGAANWGDNAWKINNQGLFVGPPGPSDRAIIVSGNDCTIYNSNVTCDTVDVEAGATLRISASASTSLTLENDNINLGTSDPDNSKVNGSILLVGNGSSRPASLIFDKETHAVTGNGKVEGSDLKCEVKIKEGKVLVNYLNHADGGFMGTLYVEEHGGVSETTKATFHNLGNVVARKNGSTGILAFTTQIIPTDASGSDWQSRACGNLTFTENATLAGDLLLDSSESWRSDITVYKSVATSGRFTFYSGAVLLSNSNSSLCYYDFVGNCFDYPCMLGSSSTFYECASGKGPDCQ